MRILLFPKQTKTTDIATPVVLCFIIQQLQLFWQLLRDLCSNRRKGKLCAAVLVRGTVGIPLCQQLSVWTMQFFFFLFLLSIFYLVLHPFFTPPQLPSILPEWLNEGLPHVNRNRIDLDLNFFHTLDIIRGNHPCIKSFAVKLPVSFPE